MDNPSEIKTNQLIEFDINQDSNQLSTEASSDLSLTIFSYSEENPIISDEKQINRYLTSTQPKSNINKFKIENQLETEQKDEFNLNKWDNNKNICKIENHLPLEKSSVNKDNITSIIPIIFTENTPIIKKNPPSLSDSTLFQNNSTQIINTFPIQTTISSQTFINSPPIFTMQPNIPLTSEVWQQQLNQHLLFFSREGISHAQLRLYPEELGLLNIQLHIEDNQAVMHFISQHSHVRSTMEAMMPLLRSALQENGVHLTQSSVGADFFNNTSDNQSHTDQDKHNHQKNSPFYPRKTISTNINQNQHIRILSPQLSGIINTFV
ncbi:flagellar hook-length control protein FliK [Providencia sneebia]|uniref:Flagellar hook-length control protein FliK n=1 Tax=Providencia sneebia DSM 19967 TaxID=1141660 RepID=K8WDC6_9GAMM|nr:flagellar hook-length control protein FliK [Providencia sneebia]EKT58574.1 flagellar hook-length control protein FliK [Providencia sneebia DSM 19967]